MDYNCKEMIHIKDGNVEYLKFKKLEKYNKNINHVITLRHGGVSDYPIESLNFRTVGNDKKENVVRNINIICDKIGIDKENVYKARQNHTSNVLILDESNKNKYLFEKYSNEEFDAYVTNCRNIATLITTADCNPIIIYDPKKNVLSNVHSGWKGTLKKVYLNAIDVMIDRFNSNVEDLIFCIGPSIKKCCFTSKEKEFKEKFTSTWDEEEKYIYYEEGSDIFHIDLAYVIKEDIIKRGIKKENIAICDICTMCNNNDFYSYRMAIQRNFNDYGTFATIAYLK